MLSQRASGHNAEWKLKEFIHVGPNVDDEEAPIPLQLLSFLGSNNPEAMAGALWFVSGFKGPARSDAHITSLLHKAVQKLTFEPAVNLYLTPVGNPLSTTSTK